MPIYLMHAFILLAVYRFWIYVTELDIYQLIMKDVNLKIVDMTSGTYTRWTLLAGYSNEFIYGSKIILYFSYFI
jgi:hypothetical protein